jgi:hypothetical protein
VPSSSCISTRNGIGRYRAVWIGFAFAAVAFLVFGSSMRYFFSQDDFIFLLRASHVGSLTDFVSAFLAGDHFYRPVPRVLFFVTMYRLFGLNAPAYHVVSLLTHIANSLLVYALAFWFSRDCLIAGVSGLIYASHATVAFLAVHWVSGIQDLSVAFWCLLSLWLYVRFRSTRYAFWLVLSSLAFSIALLSKELAVTLPALVILLDWTASRVHGSRFRVGRVVRTATIYGVIVLAYLVLRSLKTTTMVPTEGPYRWDISLTNIWHNLSYYLSDALYLSDWAMGHTWRQLATMIGALSLLTIGWRLRDRVWPVIALGLGWFVITLSPVLLLSQRVYSFYAYYPLAGMVLAMAAAIIFLGRLMMQELLPRQPSSSLRLMISLLAVVFFVLGWLNWSLLVKHVVLSQDPAGILDKSRIASHAVMEISSVYPTLPESSILCVANATNRDIWAFGLGAMFQLYYPLEEVVFTEAGEQMQSEIDCDYVFHYTH